jgi:hypothetical protein
MSLRRLMYGFLLWCTLLCVVSGVALASEYHGQVTFGGLPVPGSTVTVTATQGDKKVVAITDDQGLFTFADLADGNWTLTIEMTGFAPLKQEIAVAASAPAGTFELKLLSLDQIRVESKPLRIQPSPTGSASVAATSAPSAPTAAAGKAAAAAKGAAPKPAAGEAPAAPLAPDATAQQANDGFLINGSVNNAATSQFSQNQAFGNNRSGGRSLYNGNVFLRLDNSTLDAAQFSVAGVPETKPEYNNFTAGLNFGGPLNIPHLMPRGPYFGIFYTRSDNNTVSATPAIIPTPAEQSGNLSGVTNVTAIYVPTELAQPGITAPACTSSLLGLGITQAQIAAGTAQFPNNQIPSTCISSVSTKLLDLYPQQPNLASNALGYNYQIPLSTSSHVDTLGLSMQKQLGNKNNVNGRYNLSTTRTSTPSVFGFLDSSNVLGMNANVNWNHRFTQRLSGILGYTYSRQRSQTIPFFADKNDIQATAGITGASATPAYWGPPTLGFQTISSLSDGVSAYNRFQTSAISYSMYWTHFRHNVQFGGDFRRQEANYLTESNPYGLLTFTGAATRSSAGVGGSDLADFLLGVPDNSAIAYGNADKYLRQSVYDAFVTDDFRVSPEFSMSIGARWEFGSPPTELKGRLVNLDIAPGFSAVAPVLGSSPKGTLTGQSYPSSLVRPDYSRPEPRIGIAWRPISGSSLLIRSGYDVTNDTSLYQQSAYAMAQQAPLSTSLNVANSSACAFNIASPFTVPCSTATPDNFATDPNFKVGYVQTWNLAVQRDLPGSLQMIATYTGIKGTRGVQEFLPNTCPPSAEGSSIACSAAPAGYYYRTSGGNLTREAGSLDLRRRLRNGFQARVLYTYSKMLDDDYSLSGQGGVMIGSGVAQDWLNLSGQRGLSTTDQRHLVNFTATYTTGMGLGGKTLLTGWKGAVYKEWNIQTTITAGSGLPETPIYGGASAQGAPVAGTVRPNLTGQPLYSGAPGYFVNVNAFAAPVNQWGNARRDSIEGPDQFTMNAVLLRTFRLHDRTSLDAQLSANNVLNHVVYTGWNTNWTANSTTFGAPLNANQMRTIALQFRVRF